ncbi:MAG TPA: OmpH family outer membrane protein [Azospirillaceae bacterium]|nr:OmpH family outer membrane protein [Azospirillaceae bacterium]
MACFRLAPLWLAAALAAGVPAGAMAASAPPPADPGESLQVAAAGDRMQSSVVAVLDVRLLQQQATASISIQEQLEAARTRAQAEFAREEEKVRLAEDELKKLRPTISEQEFDQRRRALEQQVNELQRKAQNLRRALDSAYGEAVGQIRETMLKIVKEVADAKGATVVLPKDVLLYQSDPSLDITDAVLQRMNAQLPRVTMKQLQ